VERHVTIASENFPAFKFLLLYSRFLLSVFAVTVRRPQPVVEKQNPELQKYFYVYAEFGRRHYKPLCILSDCFTYLLLPVAYKGKDCFPPPDQPESEWNG
jgi:hypothetical protein